MQIILNCDVSNELSHILAIREEIARAKDICEDS